MGIVFILLGLFSIFSQRYEIREIENEREIVEKVVDRKNEFHKYKIFIGIFSIVVGIFCILNYIIY